MQIYKMQATAYSKPKQIQRHLKTMQQKTVQIPGDLVKKGVTL